MLSMRMPGFNSSYLGKSAQAQMAPYSCCYLLYVRPLIQPNALPTLHIADPRTRQSIGERGRIGTDEMSRHRRRSEGELLGRVVGIITAIFVVFWSD